MKDFITLTRCLCLRGIIDEFPDFTSLWLQDKVYFSHGDSQLKQLPNLPKVCLPVPHPSDCLIPFQPSSVQTVMVPEVCGHIVSPFNRLLQASLLLLYPFATPPHAYLLPLSTAHKQLKPSCDIRQHFIDVERS